MVALLVCFQIGSYLTDVFLSYLISDHTVALLALGDRMRNYPLAVPYVDPLPYYIVGTIRLAAPYPLFFLIGRWYGEPAVRWMQRRLPRLGSLWQGAERLYRKAPYPLVAFLHMNIVAVFAGASRMSMRRYLVVKVLGSLAVLFAIRQLSGLVEGSLTEIGDWLTSNRLLITIGVAVVLALLIAVQRSSGGETDVEALVHLEEELEPAAPDEGQVATAPSAVDPSARVKGGRR